MDRIESKRNPKIVHMKKLGTDKSYREKCREFICDGEKLLYEAILWDAQIIMVITCAQLKCNMPEDVQVYSASEEILEYISPLKSPQKVIFTCKMPEQKAEFPTSGRHILLENLQDPGNVGTVIRTAGAFDVDSVMLLGTCADIYNPKTIRSTMGALFRQKVAAVDIETLIALKKQGLRLLGAALRKNSEPIITAELRNSIVCVGNEGSGLSDELLDLCDGNIIIPMNEKCESLNAAVAASIIMWEMYREQ